ncbi:MAG: hypothetical protein JWL93_2017 [Hyphomicrobiales bacterium]|nr:hypothetical protein [Hyphomicrobiales bacterium]
MALRDPASAHPDVLIHVNDRLFVTDALELIIISHCVFIYYRHISDHILSFKIILLLVSVALLIIIMILRTSTETFRQPNIRRFSYLYEICVMISLMHFIF